MSLQMKCSITYDSDLPVVLFAQVEVFSPA